VVERDVVLAKVATIDRCLRRVGLVLSLYMLSGSVLQYPFGRLVDCRPSWKVGLILAGGGIGAVADLTNIPVAFVVGGLAGLAGTLGGAALLREVPPPQTPTSSPA